MCVLFFQKRHGVFLTKSLLAGILRTVETSAKGRENHMKDALQDLEALMVKAKDMVKLAAELNEKLTAATAAATSSSSSMLASSSTLSLVSQPEEVTFIRSSLSQLGVQISNTSVTLDMMKDERKWFDELARELARVLQGPPNLSSNNGDTVTGGMMKDRGIIALDEVWGGWNRARGVGASVFSIDIGTNLDINITKSSHPTIDILTSDTSFTGSYQSHDPSSRLCVGPERTPYTTIYASRVRSAPFQFPRDERPENNLGHISRRRSHGFTRY